MFVKMQVNSVGYNYNQYYSLVNNDFYKKNSSLNYNTQADSYVKSNFKNKNEKKNISWAILGFSIRPAIFTIKEGHPYPGKLMEKRYYLPLIA
ncbi:MAG: hypothetical protein MZV64_64835 [Ignavibacteriales bacterium]|nr:hypothetical protein [Ignavibacteriales bacterium]